MKLSNNNERGATPREGWEEAFKEMHKKGDDKLLIPDIFEDECKDKSNSPLKKN